MSEDRPAVRDESPEVALPRWAGERLAELLAAGYSGPLTLECRAGVIRRIVTLKTYEEERDQARRPETRTVV